MADTSFSTLLRNSFGASAAPDATLGRETRVDARTAGFAGEHDAQRVEWMGMTPATKGRGSKSDLWRIIRVEEEFNHYLAQINPEDRIVEFLYQSEKEAMPFEEALERLAVWENARIMRGAEPVTAQTRKDLGRHHFRDLGIRHGFLVSTTGQASFVDDRFPEDEGKYLKSDIEALRVYREGFDRGDVLAQLINGHDPITLYHTSIEEDIESFGDINLFGAMHFFARALNEYSKVKIGIIEEFYADPNNINKQTLIDRLNDSSFFDQAFFDRYNQERQKFGMSIFRMFHVVGSDWDEPLDFTSRDVRVEMMKNPDAQATYDFVNMDLSGPFDQDKMDAMLTVAARGMLYFSQMLADSPQRTALERQSLYRSADVHDLLNSLDLLEIKYMYTELAQSGFSLPGSHEYRRIRAQKQELEYRIKDLKANLTDAGDLGPGQEKQIDRFIKASAPVYLIERVATLPERLKKAHDFVAGAILPKDHQLSLPLDFSNCKKDQIAAPTRRTRDAIRAQRNANKPATPK